MSGIEFVIDTETTGLSKDSEYVVEIGAVEIENLIPTGRELHLYVRPPKPMPKAAEKIHGISDRFLADKPPFKAVAKRFLDFIGDRPIVAHNAKFDQGFLDAELARIDLPPLQNPIVDTLELSKQVRKGKGSHKLDAICKDYGISLAKRTKHGALLDAQILAEAYIELRGGRQRALFAAAEAKDAAVSAFQEPVRQAAKRPFRSRITLDEAVRHYEFIQSIAFKDKDGVRQSAIWADYLNA